MPCASPVVNWLSLTTSTALMQIHWSPEVDNIMMSLLSRISPDQGFWTSLVRRSSVRWDLLSCWGATLSLPFALKAVVICSSFQCPFPFSGRTVCRWARSMFSQSPLALNQYFVSDPIFTLRRGNLSSGQQGWASLGRCPGVRCISCTLPCNRRSGLVILGRCCFNQSVYLTNQIKVRQMFLSGRRWKVVNACFFGSTWPDHLLCHQTFVGLLAPHLKALSMNQSKFERCCFWCSLLYWASMHY